MVESKERKNGVILTYISIILNTLIQLVFTPFLIRYLGQSEYGLYSLMSSIIGYLTILDLGFGNAIVVYTAKYKAKRETEKEKKLLGMFKIIYYILGAFTIIIGIVLYLNIDNMFGNTMTIVELNKSKQMMLILTFNLAFSFSLNIYSSIITAYEKFTFQKILAILNILLKPLLMIPLLLLGFKSVTMCLCLTIINILILLSNYYYCKTKLNVTVKYSGFDKKIFKVILSYSIFIFIGSIVDKINWSIDQFILGIVSGTAAVSVYSVASQLNSLFINLSTAISNIMLPKISKMISKNTSNEELSKEFIKIGRIQYLIIFLMATGLIMLGKNFIIHWAGAEYEKSFYIALILIIPLCFPLIQNLGLSIMQAQNKYKFKTLMALVMSIANLIISFILAPKYGPIGCAIGTAISLIISNIIIMNFYYFKVIKLDVIRFWKEIAKMTLPFVIPICVTYIIMAMTKLEGFINLIIYGTIYVLLYALTAYYLVMNNYEKNLIISLFKSMKRGKDNEKR